MILYVSHNIFKMMSYGDDRIFTYESVNDFDMNQMEITYSE